MYTKEQAQLDKSLPGSAGRGGNWTGETHQHPQRDVSQLRGGWDGVRFREALNFEGDISKFG